MSPDYWDAKIAREAAAVEACTKLGAVLLRPEAPRARPAGFRSSVEPEREEER